METFGCECSIDAMLHGVEKGQGLCIFLCLDMVEGVAEVLRELVHGDAVWNRCLFESRKLCSVFLDSILFQALRKHVEENGLERNPVSACQTEFESFAIVLHGSFKIPVVDEHIADMEQNGGYFC